MSDLTFYIAQNDLYTLTPAAIGDQLLALSSGMVLGNTVQTIAQSQTLWLVFPLYAWEDATRLYVSFARDRSALANRISFGYSALRMD